MNGLEINVRCKACNGAGVFKHKLAVPELLTIVAPHYPDDKIPAIKAVREYHSENGDIGLLTAKRLVESVFAFWKSLDYIEVDSNQRTKRDS